MATFFGHQVLLDLLAIMGLVGIIVLIVAVHIKPPILTDAGLLDQSRARVLVVGVTASATLFTMAISGRIRDGLLRGLETDLRNAGDRLHLQSRMGNPALQEELDDVKIDRLDTAWRGALGIDNVREKVWNYKKLFIFTLCGLNTAVIVTALTPSITTRQAKYRPVIPDAAILPLSVPNSITAV